MKKNFKKGMTMIEVMVSIAIFSMAIAGFSMLFSRSWKFNSFAYEEGESTRMASNTINNIVSDLRKVRQADNGEYPVKSAANNDLVVYIDIDRDNATERVHYFLQNGSLRRGISKPSGNPVTYPASDSTVATLANYIVNDSSHPIFYYYNKNYPGDTANNPLSTPVSSVKNIRLVRVNLMINIKPGVAPDNISVESFAELRNLNDY